MSLLFSLYSMVQVGLCKALHTDLATSSQPYGGFWNIFPICIPKSFLVQINPIYSMLITSQIFLLDFLIILYNSIPGQELPRPRVIAYSLYSLVIILDRVY